MDFLLFQNGEPSGRTSSRKIGEISSTMASQNEQSYAASTLLCSGRKNAASSLTERKAWARLAEVSHEKLAEATWPRMPELAGAWMGLSPLK